MSLITRMLRGTCVYWQANGLDGYGGQTFADAVELSCRWEDVQVIFINREGREEQSKSVVYLPQDISIGDYLYNGPLTDLTAVTDDPQTFEGAREVKGFDKLPTLKYTEYLRTSYLK